MNARIEAIFRLARQTLGDKDEDRWSDQDLLDLLDLGHKDFAHHARVLRGVATIPIIPNQAVHTFPDDVFILLRAEYDNSKLRISSYDEMDELAKISAMSYDRNTGVSQVGSDFDSRFSFGSWMEDTSSEPEAIIIDKSNLDEFRIYPILNDEELENSYTFSNESGIDLDFSGAELFGTVTNIEDYTFDQVDGVVTGMYDPLVGAEVFNQLTGVVTGMGESVNKLTIRYIKTPDTLTSTEDELLTPKGFDAGLKYYIVGNALRNDLDQRNVDRGNQELVFYDRELLNAIKLVSTNATHHVDRITTYRSGF